MGPPAFPCQGRGRAFLQLGLSGRALPALLKTREVPQAARRRQPETPPGHGPHSPTDPSQGAPRAAGEAVAPTHPRPAEEASHLPGAPAAREGVSTWSCFKNLSPPRLPPPALPIPGRVCEAPLSPAGLVHSILPPEGAAAHAKVAPESAKGWLPGSCSALLPGVGGGGRSCLPGGTLLRPGRQRS